MKVTIIGKEKVNYLSKKTGKEVNGCILHFKSPIALDKGEGDKCDNEYVKTEMANGIDVGDTVEFLYNRFGTVEEIRLI